jgi:mRNA interferase RelE/StbE
MEKLEDYPEKYGKPLRGRLNGLWQLRSGKYRIWYTVEDAKVIVRAVKHKEDAKIDY